MAFHLEAAGSGQPLVEVPLQSLRIDEGSLEAFGLRSRDPHVRLRYATPPVAPFEVPSARKAFTRFLAISMR
jgi:hypothetical protein